MCKYLPVRDTKIECLRFPSLTGVRVFDKRHRGLACMYMYIHWIVESQILSKKSYNKLSKIMKTNNQETEILSLKVKTEAAMKKNSKVNGNKEHHEPENFHW